MGIVSFMTHRRVGRVAVQALSIVFGCVALTAAGGVGDAAAEQSFPCKPKSWLLPSSNAYVLAENSLLYSDERGRKVLRDAFARFGISEGSWLSRDFLRIKLDTSTYDGRPDGFAVVMYINRTTWKHQDYIPTIPRIVYGCFFIDNIYPQIFDMVRGALCDPLFVPEGIEP